MYFGKHEGTFYCYRVDGPDKYLRLLFVACPRLPLCYRDGLQWEDVVPASLVLSRPRRLIADLMATFVPKAAVAKTVQRFTGVDQIESHVTSNVFGAKRRTVVKLDAERGLASVKVDGYELKRVEYATSS